MISRLMITQCAMVSRSMITQGMMVSSSMITQGMMVSSSMVSRIIVFTELCNCPVYHYIFTIYNKLLYSADYGFHVKIKLKWWKTFPMIHQESLRSAVSFNRASESWRSGRYYDGIYLRAHALRFVFSVYSLMW